VKSPQDTFQSGINVYTLSLMRYSSATSDRDIRWFEGRQPDVLSRCIAQVTSHDLGTQVMYNDAPFQEAPTAL
jgi:hypothetical protein